MREMSVSRLVPKDWSGLKLKLDIVHRFGGYMDIPAGSSDGIFIMIAHS